MLTTKRFMLSRLRMLAFLNELEDVDGVAQSLYLSPGQNLSEVEVLLSKTFGDKEVPADLPGIATGSETGVVVFWGAAQIRLVLPPFPIRETYLTFGYDIEPLLSLLQHDYKIALILVRLGAFAVGVCEGEELITSKVGTGLIHGRHKKGGSSQRRFERHRGKQVEQFMERVGRHVQERLEPYERILDYIVYGGSKTAILELRKRCRFLGQFDERTLPPLLDIAEPRQAVLESAVGKAWSSKVIEWNRDESRDHT